MIFSDPTKKRKKMFRMAAAIGLSLFTTLGVFGTLYFVEHPSFSKPNHLDFEFNSGSTKRIALTFDDGPDPYYTPLAMKTLRQAGVPATFFFIGENMVGNRKIVAQAYDEGFEIGNHSFSHSTAVLSSPKRLRYETGLTNEILESITGHGSILYRPPFLADAEGKGVLPQFTKNPGSSMQWLRDDGYIAIGGDIFTDNIEAATVEDLLSDFDASLIKNENGYIVILHDGGGDRKQSDIAALPFIIDRLKAQGFTFVSVSSLLGLTPEEVMPKAPSRFSPLSFFKNLYVLEVTLFTPQLFHIVLELGLVLVTFRIVFILSLYAISQAKKRRRPITQWDFHEDVSVLIPAYNEELNIRGTIESIASSVYPLKEIIVIDDGSKDKTSQIARDVARDNPIVRVIRIPNGGKANALNVGLKELKTDIFVAIDGDTVFTPNTVWSLVRHFKDPHVGAVAGRVYPVNAKSLLAALQTIEYIVSQNVEKKALALINAVNVVPGAVGAWRKSAVMAAGGYSLDTIVEDQDLTLAILEAGKKVIFDEEAVSFTETPHTLSGFLKQRYRWTYGSLQCLWKYLPSSKTKFVPRIDFIIIPNLIVYNVLIPLISFLSDISLIVSLFTKYANEIWIYYLLFTLFDIAYASLALWKDAQNRHLLSLIPIQRLVYRPLLYYIVIKSLIRAFEGEMARWGKLQRTGEAQAYLTHILTPSPYHATPETVSVSLQGPGGTSFSSTKAQ